jgi:hypothetical protein
MVAGGVCLCRKRSAAPGGAAGGGELKQAGRADKDLVLYRYFRVPSVLWTGGLTAALDRPLARDAAGAALRAAEQGRHRRTARFPRRIARQAATSRRSGGTGGQGGSRGAGLGNRASIVGSEIGYASGCVSGRGV